MKLDSTSTHPPHKIQREHIEEKMHKLEQELSELQDLMWGAKTNSVLVVLQGRDTAGKDGTIKRVVGALNPRGVHVVSFGVPSEEEREHDYLWRIHRHTPRLGEFSIFNRSHYEDVLVVRVHDLVDKSIWSKRYAQINAFESALSDQGCIILKFFLHISKDEQETRLRDREKEASKAWKLNPSDWKERGFWKDYTKAYESVFDKCGDWTIVPADAKWYRNYLVADEIVKALRPYRAGWVKTLEERGKLGRAALKKYKKVTT